TSARRPCGRWRAGSSRARGGSAPDHFWARYLRVLCYFQLANGHKDDARTYWLAAKDGLTDCIRQKRGFLWNHVQLGFVHAELGEPDAAEAAFARALSLRPDDHAAYFIHVNRGVMRLRHGRPADAEKDLLHAAGLRPTLYQAHLNLARLYQRQD